MYTRSVEEAPSHIIKNRKPVFGLFKGTPEHLDIKGLEAPFNGIPLPPFITNLRIKARLTFFFNVGPYIGSIGFFDGKIFGFAEVMFWDKESGKKLTYRSFMGPRFRFVPTRISNAVCVSFKKSRYIRISWDHKRDRLSVLFNVSGNSARAPSNAALIAHFNTAGTAEITTVSPAQTMRRCSATWFTFCAVHGAVSIGRSGPLPPVSMKDTDGLGLLVLNRSYYKLRTRGKTVTGLGTIDDHQIIFSFITTTLANSRNYDYNDNLLFSDGTLSPIPPVCITHPFGLENQWVIQDTEGMVDLTFTPVSDNYRNFNAVALKTTYHVIYGKFTGVLTKSDGEKLQLRNFTGIVEENMLRL